VHGKRADDDQERVIFVRLEMSPNRDVGMAARRSDAHKVAFCLSLLVGGNLKWRQFSTMVSSSPKMQMLSCWLAVDESEVLYLLSDARTSTSSLAKRKRMNDWSGSSVDTQNRPLMDS
jgi:hypothetical protein